MSEVKTDSVVNVSGDNDDGIDLSTNDVVKVKTANTERMRVTSDGQGGVAIGGTAQTPQATARLLEHSLRFKVAAIVGALLLEQAAILEAMLRPCVLTMAQMLLPLSALTATLGQPARARCYSLPGKLNVPS